MSARRALVIATLAGLLLSPATTSAQERTFLDVVMNGVSKGDTLVVLREGDALVAVQWLTDAGVTGMTGVTELVDGAAFVSLASLAPTVAFSVDERDLRLTLTVAPDRLAHLVRDLRQGRPRDLVYRRNTSGFVNYAVNGGTGGEYDLFSEGGFSAAGALVTTTMAVSGGAVTRGLTNMTIDDRAGIRRWVVGDSMASTGVLGGDAVIAGVNVGRDFNLDPYFVRHPTLSLSTPVASPSVVEVHVNGRLVREEQVQPGMLDLRNLPLTTGHNNTRIVIRDPFGTTRELSNGYYSTASVLAPGLHDYQYTAGVTRQDISRTSWNYAAPAFLGRHRVGVTDVFTAGGRIEATDGLVSGGPTMSLRLPFGELEASMAASLSPRGRGAAAAASFGFSAPRLSAGTSLRVIDARYATISLAASDARPEKELAAFLSMPLGAGCTLSTQHSHAALQGGATRMRTDMMLSRRLGRHADLMASAARSAHGGRPAMEATVAMTLMIGGRTSMTSTAAHTAEATRTAVDVQRPLPMGTGYGFQLRSETEKGSMPSGAVQYQGAHGRYEVRAQSSGGRAYANVNVAGALVAIGGGVYATRPVRGSFALVQVPGVGDVRGFSSNQEVGRTNRRGNIFVPDLLPYYANLLTIADTDIPIDYVVPRVQETIAPPFRGGALVRFAVQRVQRSAGRMLVVIEGVERVPTYAELVVTVEGKRYASPVGASGEFYFEDLPVGRHSASVDFGGRSCTFMVDLPAVTDVVARLGTLRCTMGAAR